MADARWALGWISLLAASLGLYFLLAGSLNRGAQVIGAVVAVLAVVGSRAVLRERAARFSGRLRWLVQAWRLPKYAVTGTWEIFVVLFRHLFAGEAARSLFLEVPFDTGAGEDGATRRALATAYTTITPNFIVLGFDAGRGRMIYHQLQESSIPEMVRRLGAAP